MFEPTSEVMEGMPVMRWRNEDNPWRQYIAEAGRRYDSESMVADLVVDLLDDGTGVVLPDSKTPFGWRPGIGKDPIIGSVLGNVDGEDEAGSHILLPDVQASASWVLADRTRLSNSVSSFVKSFAFQVSASIPVAKL